MMDYEQVRTLLTLLIGRIVQKNPQFRDALALDYNPLGAAKRIELICQAADKDWMNERLNEDEDIFFADDYAKILTEREHEVPMYRCVMKRVEECVNETQELRKKLFCDKNGNVFVSLFADSTGLYEEEEVEDDNLTEMAFPLEILRMWYLENICGTYVKSFEQETEIAFLRWLVDESYADQNVGLFDYAMGMGFIAEREDWRDLTIISVTVDSDAKTAEYRVEVGDHMTVMVKGNADKLEIVPIGDAEVPTAIQKSVLSFIRATRSEFEDIPSFEQMSEEEWEDYLVEQIAPGVGEYAARNILDIQVVRLIARRAKAIAHNRGVRLSHRIVQQAIGDTLSHLVELGLQEDIPF